MNIRLVAISFSLGALYLCLWLILIYIRMPLSLPDWWDPTFGVSAFSAITWMQLDHSLNLVLAGTPVAIAIAWLLRSDWKRASLLASVIPTSLMLYDALRAYFGNPHNHEISFSLAHVISSFIDVAKISAILYVLVLMAIRLLPSNKQGLGHALQRPRS